MGKNKKGKGGGGDGCGGGGGGGGGAVQQKVAEGAKQEAKENASVGVEKKQGEGGPVEGGGNSDGGEGKKKEEGPLTVVLKVDMHCEGCTRKIRRSIRGFPGVEGVAVDAGDDKLTVVGRVDPWGLRDRVAAKTRKTVVLVSPTNVPRKEPKPPKEQQKPPDNKPKVPVVSTVVLKMRLHCHGCIQRIRSVLLKINGVEQVAVEVEKELVTVKGTMDPKLLPAALKAKMKRDVEVVQPKKDRGGGGEKKEKEKEKEKENEEKEKGEKKEKDGKAEASKLDCYAGYRIEMVQAPQLFSDENPNACAVM